MRTTSDAVMRATDSNLRTRFHKANCCVARTQHITDIFSHSRLAFRPMESVAAEITVGTLVLPERASPLTAQTKTRHH